MSTETFYKLALPSGWDFYTGNTINYRDSLGKDVVCPKFNKDGNLCSSAFIHASRIPEQCFIGAKVPCSAFEVAGIPLKEDSDKCGFEKFIVVRELQPENLFKWDYKEAANPVRPFKLAPPPKIAEEHIILLRSWDSVGASVGASVWASVGASVGDSVGASVWASVGDSVGDSVWASVGDFVWASVRASVWASVRASVWASVWASVGDSVGDSVGASVGAYTGWIFRDVVEKWKGIDHEPGVYPFQPAVDLWKQGLVSSYDGKVWRLHGGEKAEVLWEGKGINAPWTGLERRKKS